MPTARERRRGGDRGGEVAATAGAGEARAARGGGDRGGGVAATGSHRPGVQANNLAAPWGAVMVAGRPEPRGRGGATATAGAAWRRPAPAAPAWRQRDPRHPPGGRGGAAATAAAGRGGGDSGGGMAASGSRHPGVAATGLATPQGAIVVAGRQEPRGRGGQAATAGAGWRRLAPASLAWRRPEPATLPGGLSWWWGVGDRGGWGVHHPQWSALAEPCTAMDPATPSLAHPWAGPQTLIP